MSQVHPFPPYAPLFITSTSLRFTVSDLFPANVTALTFASAAWPSANLAVYVPFHLPFAYPVERMFVVNGGTANGNIDLGIYRLSGSAVFTNGAVAQSGTNARQYVTCKVLLPAGSYYMGLSLSSGTGTTFRASPSSALLRICGHLQESSANPLPSSMTPASTANAYLPCFGITRLASGF